MYRLGAGLSTSKNIFIRANFERLGRREGEVWKFCLMVLIFEIYVNET